MSRDVRSYVDDVAGRAPIEWDAVVPLGRDAVLPAFPVDALPDWLGNFAKAEAAAVQVPVDMPAVFALGALAAAVGGFVRVKAWEGFEEGTNLYTVVAMPPSSVKSPVHRDATAPLAEIEAELQEREASNIRKAESRKAVGEKMLKRAEDAAAKANAGERKRAMEDVDELRKELDEIGDPVRPRIIVDDTTPEQLKTLLCLHGGKLAMLSAESSLFGIMAGARYNADPNIEAILAAHSGDRMQIDRRGRSERIERPALTICIAVQPSVLRRAAANTIARERGMFARFLYSLPQSNVGARDFSSPPRPVGPEVIAIYRERLRKIAFVARDVKEPMVLRLSDDARAAFVTFRTRVERDLGYGGSLAGIEAWAGKLHGAVLRLAGLIQIATAPGYLVEVGALERAIALAEYFVEHAKAAHDEMDEDEGALRARKVVAWMRGRIRFTRDEVRAAMKGRLSADELDPVLSLLRQRNYLAERKDVSPTGGRPLTTYYVNPEVSGATGVRS